MKFSENWLRELVDVPAATDELAARLTLCGLEVEDIVRLGGGLDGVVVGEIVAAEKHPDADKLQVCTVAIGGDHPLQIVCGAPNARVGLRAPLAMLGSTVGTITIKAAKLRGVESNGMLCSARELGLDDDASGLLELADDAVVGQALSEHLQLPDTTLELGLTPNRADCLGMHGLAREVAAEFSRTIHIATPKPVPLELDAMLSVRVDAPADCPRYCGRVVRGLDRGVRTPQWLGERLRRSGIRPINALVDVTNYVMLETGQPLHAFDERSIEGGIVVRRAGANERLRLLDGREIDLDDGFLVVADDSGALALAGIMGGQSSKVGDDTRDVFLEAAHFSPSAISGRARRLGMHTDASHRFERGVDAELPRLAIERATELLIEIAGGRAGPVGEAVSLGHLPRRHAISLRRQRLQRVLGVAIGDDDVVRILVALGMHVVANAHGWLATPPSARFDITIEEDLIEEVARIHGYANIPAQPPRGEITPAVISEERIAIAQVRDQLAARGYHEAITYAFVAGELLGRWGMATDAITLANPLSSDLAVMRTSLLPGLVAALDGNRKRQQSRVRLFEVGRRYRLREGVIVETDCVAGVACGAAVDEQWSEPAHAIDFFDIKGDVESLFELAGTEAGVFGMRRGAPAWLHPGRSATVMRGERVVGMIGALDPRLQKVLDLDIDTYVFELEIDALVVRPLPRAKELSRYPSVRRDIAVVVPEEVDYATVIETVRQAVGPLILDVFLFDRYAGINLGEGVKSLAIGLILQDSSRTLTDRDADHCVALAVSALEIEHKGRLRG